jgi:penicillin-binding protein 1A
MTGGSLPAQTWHEIMVAAHQGVEIKELPGVGAGAPSAPPSGHVAHNGAQKPAEYKPPPPVLTKRGADILVHVEKLLDDAAKTAGEPAKPTKPVSSGSAGLTDSFASASPEASAAPAGHKN